MLTMSGLRSCSLLRSFLGPLLLAFFAVFVADSFRLSGQYRGTGISNMAMKWSFTGGREGLVGSEGEFFFSGQKPGKLKVPSALYGQPFVVPIFPYPQVLVPTGEETLNVFEMRHRQLLVSPGVGRRRGVVDPTYACSVGLFGYHTHLSPLISHFRVRCSFPSAQNRMTSICMVESSAFCITLSQRRRLVW
jgi:hypothetical protein